jgi:hypothetical protein
MAVNLPNFLQLLIPRKTQDPVAQPDYGIDMRAIEQWSKKVVMQLVAGSGVTLSPSSGLGPTVTVSASASGGGCLSPCVVVSAFSGDVASSPPSGAATIDTYAVVTGDRILLTEQTNAQDNGVWIANTAGTWTRPADFAHGATIKDGTIVPVGYTQGSTVYGTLWLLQQDTVVDTTNPTSLIALAGVSSFLPALPFLGGGGSQQIYNEFPLSVGRKVDVISGAHTLQGNESIILGNGAITLPLAGMPAYFNVIIKDNGAGTLSIVPGAGTTLDGSAATVTPGAWGFREVQLGLTSGHWITV